MASGGTIDDDVIARAGLADAEHHGVVHNLAKGSIDVKKEDKEVLEHSQSLSVQEDDDWYEGKPTVEEMHTLRRVSGKIMWSMWTIAFVELCERFSYYGSSVLYTNFVNHPLPPGSNTGAPLESDGQAGALGQGPKAAQGIYLFNQFFAFFMPLLG